MCGTRIHRTWQHAHQPPTALVTDAVARCLTAHRPLRYASVPLSLRLIPTFRSARSSWLEARVSYCRLQPAAASHAASTHARTRLRTHPQHARTHRHRKRSVVAFSLFHAQPPALLPPSSDFAARPATFLFFFRVPTLFLAGRSLFLFASRCVDCSFFLLASHCAARHACLASAALSFCLLRIAPRATPARK